LQRNLENQKGNTKTIKYVAVTQIKQLNTKYVVSKGLNSVKETLKVYL